jgi:hypothetical protein
LRYALDAGDSLSREVFHYPKVILFHPACQVAAVRELTC